MGQEELDDFPYDDMDAQLEHVMQQVLGLGIWLQTNKGPSEELVNEVKRLVAPYGSWQAIREANVAQIGRNAKLSSAEPYNLAEILQTLGLPLRKEQLEEDDSSL